MRTQASIERSGLFSACKCPPDTCDGRTIVALTMKIGNANIYLHRNVEVFSFAIIVPYYMNKLTQAGITELNQ